VIIDYKALEAHQDLSSEINEGFGQMGLGVIGVKNVPNFIENRLNLLAFSRQLGNLDPEKKKELTRLNPTDFVGLREPTTDPSDIIDYLKGSYYANSEVDSSVDSGDRPENIWPKTCLPGFESSFKTLGQQTVAVGTLLSCHLDRLIKSKFNSYEGNKIENAMKNHKNHISRLIYYYPQFGKSYEWCLWHQDFTLMTALAPSLYMKHSTGQIISSQEIDDPKTGLFVRNRKSQLVKIKVEPDVLLFQMGEVTQILSGGMFECTPHCVLNDGKLDDVSRTSFITFMQPKGYFEMTSTDPQGIYIEHEGMYTLKGRWEKGINFNDYLQRCIKAIY
jgi:isopenicillin N synthase-like dioxygenase